MTNKSVTACMGGHYFTAGQIRKAQENHFVPEAHFTCTNDSIIWKEKDEIEKFLCGNDKFCTPMIFEDELNAVRKACRLLQVAPDMYESLNNTKLETAGADGKPLVLKTNIREYECYPEDIEDGGECPTPPLDLISVWLENSTCDEVARPQLKK